jgi:hypothetical protein
VCKILLIRSGRTWVRFSSACQTPVERCACAKLALLLSCRATRCVNFHFKAKQFKKWNLWGSISISNRRLPAWLFLETGPHHHTTKLWRRDKGKNCLTSPTEGLQINQRDGCFVSSLLFPSFSVQSAYLVCQGIIVHAKWSFYTVALRFMFPGDVAKTRLLAGRNVIFIGCYQFFWIVLAGKSL